MDKKIEKNIEVWKKHLLDLGMRNQLLNFKEPRMSSLYITEPSSAVLYKKIVADEAVLTFPTLDRSMESGKKNSKSSKSGKADNIFSYDYSAEAGQNELSEEDEKTEETDAVIPGDVETNKSVKDLQGVLKNLSNKAKRSFEEQGINILYLSFGFLEWTDTKYGKDKTKAPLILVPVVLKQADIISPYTISVHEDEIVVNPTLAFKLENDYNIVVPSFDPNKDSLKEYYASISKIVKQLGWTVTDKVALSLLSFLKINMYKEMKDRAEAIGENPIVKALCGVKNNINDVPDMRNYDHDMKEIPDQIYQVMDADSSQMDAIELSKRGVSFVLQGPPGTGKSQTITNIIAEAMAAGKKVLFVSEKMAALEVVYKRLGSAGLSDFCLVLHSYKANKKEVLNSLEKTMRLKYQPSMKATQEDLMSLRKLAEKRHKLNDYCYQLHRVIQPMNQSAFDANGIIASLEGIPYKAVDLSEIEVGKISKEQLFELRDKIQSYVDSLKKLPESYEDNTWKNCAITRVSFALSHDIKANFDRFAEKIGALDEGIEDYSAELHLTNNVTSNNIEDYCKMLKFCNDTEGFPEIWLISKPTDLIALADERIKLEYRQRELKKLLDKEYNPQFYALPCESIESSMRRNFNDLQQIFTDQYQSPSDLISDADRLLSVFSNAAAYIKPLIQTNKTIADHFSFNKNKKINRISGILALCRFLKAYGTDFKADRCWFDSRKWTVSTFNDCYHVAVEYSEKAKELREKLLSVYDKDILTFDYKPVLKRYSEEYISWYRTLKGDYRADSKTLRYMQIDCKNKLSYEQVLDNLKILQEYRETVDYLEQRRRGLSCVLGGGYVGIDSDYKKIKEAAETFRTVIVYLDNDVPKSIQDEILNEDNIGMYSETVAQLEGILDNLTLVAVNEILNYKPEALDEYVSLNDTVSNAYKRIKTELDKIAATAKQGTDCSDMYKAICSLCDFNNQTHELQISDVDCKRLLGYVFNEHDTDWDMVLKQLEWFNKFKEYAVACSASHEFMVSVALDRNARILMDAYADFLEESCNGIAQDIKWLESLFNTNENIRSKTISNLNNFILRCRNNLQGLEFWIDFCNAKKICEKAGLAAFITQSLAEKMNPDDIEGIFLKRFEHLWLDAVMPQLPAVAYFRSSNQNQLIEEFRRLDKIQLEINKVRIRQLLISRLPDLGAFTSGKDEVSILRKEMEKQRKIMPIRKLFASIPNLLPCLKPCLMMSPLSVSLFLQDQNYKFDMVIFDEASQVQTENAIGAISRGAQVIIAGDIHQLPPTSFFTATVSGSDEYDEDDENDTDSFDSVLSEARTVMPEQPLMWHYRSRNESLIAFSNYKIYEKRLITFPSPVEDNDSEGVEYIYVEDGLYDRGGKRTNIIEAQKVVDVVFQQINMHPERSMGVITFSEAQMNCVENELIRRRLAHPEYEPYFDEGKEEAFFVKNLENVQGDERDTIIFSIGYAKSNPLQPLQMGFGPLSKQGGYRRLNVAVTRAKYAVKLVGSILPTDMNVTDETPQGVRLLRDYIDFAMNGPSALENELIYNDAINTESPFEEAVYDFLTSKGYSVATQVGCSGYRIDMAIRHPKLHGKFVIGVECDGAMYHSSRTARERDRLRQAVLESMGWKFVRIWSTDWIKDPISEGKRVVSEINKAIRDYGKSTSMTPDKEKISVVGEVSLPENNSIFEDKRFRKYNKVYVPYSPIAASYPAVAKMLDKIIKSQSPIHVDELFKQIAPMFAAEYATGKVKDGTAAILKLYANTYDWKVEYPFIYDKNQTVIMPMVSNEQKRKMEHISPAEVAVAMQVVLERSFGIDRKGLYSATGKLFGYNNTSVNVKQIMDAAYRILNYKDLAYEDEDGKILLKR